MPFSPNLSRSTSEGKNAHSALAAWAGSRNNVPPDAIARAIELRDRLAAAHKLWDEQFQALVRQARPAGAVMRTSRKHFDVFARNWARLPRAGGLRRSVKRDTDGGLQAIETRVVPSRIALHNWEVGGDELSISIIIGTVIFGPGRYDEAAATLVTIGMHALARYYERGGDCSDAAIERDLRVLLHSYPATVADRDREFRIPTAAAGLWAGTVMMAQADAQPVMAVRTFTPKETGGFRFAEVARLTRRAGER